MVNSKPWNNICICYCSASIALLSLYHNGNSHTALQAEYPDALQLKQLNLFVTGTG